MHKASVITISTLLFLGACNADGSQRETSKTSPVQEEAKENRVSPAETAQATVGNNTVTINYGSPRVKGRTIWGGLVPYGEVWRTGANEATTITFTQDVLINGQLLKKDTYAFFTIPGPDMWTLIFNLNEKQWGAFKYSEADDALRVNVAPTATSELFENMLFTITADSTNTGGIIQLAWENIKVEFRFSNALNP
ncbi:MAG: DUF2911 domain-containing protein [Chitinophagales bacterium]